MRLLKLLLLVAVLFGGYKWWQGREAEQAFAASAGPNGFVPVEMPSGAKRNVVLVLAPANCPSEQAQRTEALVAALASAGVPVARGTGFSFEVDNPSAEQRAGIDRAVEVFRRGAPTVFVNGMAMSNPSAAQTVAEYRRTRG